jgi:hypothetical protein
LDENRYLAVVDLHFEGFDVRVRGEASSRAHVELPTVKGALDYMGAYLAFGQGGAFVRTDVFDCEVLSFEVEKRKLRAIRKLNGSTASRREVFHPSDNDSFFFSRLLLNCFGDRFL